MSLADVQITLARHALIARLSGEIDMSTAEEMGATVIGATPNEASGVVLDLAAVEYLDSAGIYVIYGMRASLQARGQSLILVIPPESPVHDALRLSGAERPGEVADTVDAALRTIERASPAEA
ncbi:MAG TPA: STAS domain-containing protein [Solirubrobacteraceae bacterium]|nr:STAS domain-containing protein [Solirubrobacteraceae bacterium]